MMIFFILLLLGSALVNANNVMLRISNRIRNTNINVLDQSKLATITDMPNLQANYRHLEPMHHIPIVGVWNRYVYANKPLGLTDRYIIPIQDSISYDYGVWYVLDIPAKTDTEVRVSWSAENPVDIELELYSKEECNPPNCTYLIRVRAIWDAYTRPLSSNSSWITQLPKTVNAVLVYEPCFFGIQSTVFPMIGVMVLVLVFAWFVTLPIVKHLLDRVYEMEDVAKKVKTE